ncbi:hypothetical protein ABZP36_009433 [Zizania latifolia]
MSMEDATYAFGGAMEMLNLSLSGRLEGLLLRHGSMLPKGAEHEIPLIQRDLQEIISILHGHREPQLEGHGHAMRVRCWMTEVRELAYDMEDCIDLYEHAADAGFNTIPRRRNITRWRWSTTRSKRIPWISEKLKQRLWMANKIREFSLRTQEALQRHKMCNNLGGITTARGDDAPSSSSGSGHHPAPCTELGIGIGSSDVRGGRRQRAPCTEFGHVGIDTAMNKIEEWLTDGEEKLKVISIVGVAGVGKTTLVNEIYRKLGRQFDCRAFVRSSQKPDMKRLLIGMLSQDKQISTITSTHSEAVDAQEELLRLRQYMDTEEDLEKYRFEKERKEPARMTRMLKKLEELDDGFSWRKYGQKDILGAKHPRGYYRCTHRNSKGCRATRHVQRTDGDPSLFNVVYLREHTCGDNAHSDNQGSSQHAASSDKQEQSTTTYDRPDHTQHRDSALMMQPNKATVVQRRVVVNLLDDGFKWRKYGQKQVFGDMQPRSYYRCANKNSKGCRAIKQVQQTDGDPSLFNVVYLGEHTCGGSLHSDNQLRWSQSAASSEHSQDKQSSTITSSHSEAVDAQDFASAANFASGEYPDYSEFIASVQWDFSDDDSG